MLNSHNELSLRQKFDKIIAENKKMRQQLDKSIIFYSQTSLSPLPSSSRNPLFMVNKQTHNKIRKTKHSEQKWRQLKLHEITEKNKQISKIHFEKPVKQIKTIDIFKSKKEIVI